MKACVTCKYVKSLTEYSADVTKADGLRAVCKRCDAETKLQYRYGLTHDTYAEILDSQGNVCAICRRSQQRMTVDHDHSCCEGERSCGSCIRGIICDSCNRGIGMFMENTNALASAIIYLEGLK